MTRMLLGGALVLVLGLLLGLCTGIGWLFGDAGIVVGLIVWMALVRPINALVMNYGGYMVKAGHIAVIAEAMKTGQVPANQVNYGKEKVKERFATSNIYFAVDKLVTGAVKQIQNGIDKLGNKLDFIPGMEAVAGLAKFFISISLGYIDECCFGWTFYNPQQGAFKSAADGVVIYAQNWKTLLKDAAKTMAKTIGLTVLIALVIFVPVGLLFKIFKWSGLVAFLLACLIAWVVKFAFMDSYIMCQMMVSFMQVAPTTVITFDLYSKLCGISGKFKELYNKGQAEDPQPAYAGATAASAPVTPTAEPSAKPVFCGQCGTKNEPGTRFCGNCGAPM